MTPQEQQQLERLKKVLLLYADFLKLEGMVEKLIEKKTLLLS